MQREYHYNFTFAHRSPREMGAQDKKVRRHFAGMEISIEVPTGTHARASPRSSLPSDCIYPVLLNVHDNQMNSFKVVEFYGVECAFLRVLVAHSVSFCRRFAIPSHVHAAFRLVLLALYVIPFSLPCIAYAIHTLRLARRAATAFHIAKLNTSSSYSDAVGVCNVRVHARARQNSINFIYK